MKKNVLIIGAGPAGLAAAEAAASLGAAVTLCGGELYPPYWRPRLTRCLSQPVAADSLAIHKPGWYAQNGVRLLTGCAAERIDPAGRRVFWSGGGESSPFDALVVAAGAMPALPQIAGAEHAYTLRNYGDAVMIRDAALKAGRAVVIGGGLLGLETAWELNAAGVQVSLIERSLWLLPKQLNSEGGMYLQRKLESSGIGFAIGKDPSSALHEAYSGACVVIAAGVRANLGALEGSGIATNRGIVVDEHMRTSSEGVYACGDVAEFNGRSWGLLAVAQEQGKTAGANAAGGDAVYAETPPSPMLKVGPVSVFSVGELAQGEGTRVLSGETESGYACLMFTDDALTGAALVGGTKAGMKLKKAIVEKRKFTNSNINEILSSL